MNGLARPEPDEPAPDEKDRLIKELREAVQARDELLDIAAHELRNPMGALLMQVETALRLAPPEQTQLHGRLQRLERLIGRIILRASALLDVSRLNAGTFHPIAEPVDLAEIVRATAEGYAAQADQAGIALRTVAPEKLETTSDRMALEQIIDNLLSNAIKFGAGAPVEIGLARAGATVRLTVRDHGPGITPEDQVRVFGRFERAMTSRPHRGFGLGLWITRGLVEALGGTIMIASTSGEGATFIVTLPLSPKAAQEHYPT